MRKFKNTLYKIKTNFAMALTVFFFLTITLYILVKGVASLNFGFVFGTEKQSMFPAIINTLLLVFLTLLVAVPIGVSSAIYLNEYSKPGSKIVKIIRITTESLSGIPSIIYGLFGFLFFVLYLKWSWSLLSGICTLSIMVLPTIIRSSEESLKAVPDSFREGSYALGAGKLRTILKIILPSAIAGILVSIILSVGRIVGETAALVLTAGSVMAIPSSLLNSGASLSVVMYTLTSEGSDFGKAYAVAIVLIVVVFAINLFANKLSDKFKK